VPLGLLALVGAISTITSPNPASGLVDTVKLATVVLMIAVLNQVCRTERDAKVVLVAAIASTLAPLAVALYQGALGTGLHYSDGFGRATGTFNHPNPFAIYLCFSILMLVGLFRFVHGRTRLAVTALTVGCTIALYFTYTRSAWISTVVGLLAIAAFSGKKIVGFLAVGIVVAGLAIPSVASRFADLDETVTQSGAAANSLVWRFEYWGQALTLTDDPLLGSGLSAVRVEGSEEKSPHNDFIRVFVETGILGLFAYLWFLLRGAFVVAAGRRGTDRTSLWYGVVLGFGGVFAAYVLLSVVSNVITQLVLLWYLAAYASLAIAAPRLAPRPADERALVDA
jgi:O-antigen ligase